MREIEGRKMHPKAIVADCVICLLAQMTLVICMMNLIPNLIKYSL